MELIEIEAFVTIVNSGAFTRAADRLGISQPAISRRIDLLESELGAALFERLRTGARLTDAGEAFLPFALRVLADLRDGASAVRELSSGDRGTLTLVIVGTLASTSLMERLKQFRAAHPGIRLRLETANSDGVSHLVRSGEVQLGLRYYDDSSTALYTTQVADERLVIVCAQDSAIVPSPVLRPSDLSGLPWVSFPVGSGSSGEPFAQAMDRSLAELGLADAERIVIDSLTAQKRMIEAGFGIGLVLESAVTEELRLGTLRVLDLEDFERSAPVFMIRRSGGYQSTAMQRLIAVLTDGTENG
ncbi:LysR family transcriptional regulator [soil metagenome]